MEIDPEMKGAGNSYTTEFRQYDPRLGRWASLDPLMMEFPEQSPYVAFDNNPIFFTDPYGLSAGPGDPPTGLPENPVHEQIAKADDDKEYQYVIDQDGNGSWGRYNGEFEVVANKNPMKYVTGNQYKDSPDHDLTKEEIPEYGLNSIDKFAIKNPDDPNSVYKYLEFCFSNGCSAGMDDPGGDLAKEGLSLLEHFVIGGGTQMGLGPDSYASDRAGEDSDFLEMAERFESEAMIYYEKHGNLNQFNGKQILQEEKPYMNDTWYLHTIMGGMAQVTAVINSVSADEISVTYYLWDHFGGGTNDTKTDLPGLSALYHLQHNFNEGNNAKYFTPFVWYIRIER
jgi:RHS repeat-associated protein